MVLGALALCAGWLAARLWLSIGPFSLFLLPAVALTALALALGVATVEASFQRPQDVVPHTRHTPWGWPLLTLGLAVTWLAEYAWSRVVCCDEVVMGFVSLVAWVVALALLLVAAFAPWRHGRRWGRGDILLFLFPRRWPSLQDLGYERDGKPSSRQDDKAQRRA